MKNRSLLISLVSLLSLLAVVELAVALQWPAAPSGYSVTTDAHGDILLPGNEVIAYAATTDPNVKYIVITWLKPDETEMTEWREVFSYDGGDGSVSTPPDWTGGTPVWWVQSEARTLNIPDPERNWAVKAYFLDHNEEPVIPPKDDKISVRATSIHVVPELPFGTMTAVVSMLAALMILGLKHRK